VTNTGTKDPARSNLSRIDFKTGKRYFLALFSRAIFSAGIDLLKLRLRARPGFRAIPSPNWHVPTCSGHPRLVRKASRNKHARHGAGMTLFN